MSAAEAWSTPAAVPFELSEWFPRGARSFHVTYEPAPGGQELTQSTTISPAVPVRDRCICSGNTMSLPGGNVGQCVGAGVGFVGAAVGDVTHGHSVGLRWSPTLWHTTPSTPSQSKTPLQPPAVHIVVVRFMCAIEQPAAHSPATASFLSGHTSHTLNVRSPKWYSHDRFAAMAAHVFWQASSVGTAAAIAQPILSEHLRKNEDPGRSCANAACSI